jgi:hypothetical protein
VREEPRGMDKANVSPLSGDMSSFFFSLGMVKVSATYSKQSKRQGASMAHLQ